MCFINSAVLTLTTNTQINFLWMWIVIERLRQSKYLDRRGCFYFSKPTHVAGVARATDNRTRWQHAMRNNSPLKLWIWKIDFVSYEVGSCPWKVTVWSSEAHKSLRQSNPEVYSRISEQLSSGSKREGSGGAPSQSIFQFQTFQCATLSVFQIK